MSFRAATSEPAVFIHADMQQTCAGLARASKADLLQTGTEKLQADIEYCKTHEVRPFVFAEHASTAADFLFHIGDFAAAEKMLADAMQVC